MLKKDLNHGIDTGGGDCFIFEFCCSYYDNLSLSSPEGIGRTYLNRNVTIDITTVHAESMN